MNIPLCNVCLYPPASNYLLFYFVWVNFDMNQFPQVVIQVQWTLTVWEQICFKELMENEMMLLTLKIKRKSLFLFHHFCYWPLQWFTNHKVLIFSIIVHVVLFEIIHFIKSCSLPVWFFYVWEGCVFLSVAIPDMHNSLLLISS